MNLPAALKHPAVCTEINVLRHKSLVYKEDSEPGEGKDPPWAESGRLGCPALIPASEEPVSTWSLLRQMPE